MKWSDPNNKRKEMVRSKRNDRKCLCPICEMVCIACQQEKSKKIYLPKKDRSYISGPKCREKAFSPPQANNGISLCIIWKY